MTTQEIFFSGKAKWAKVGKDNYDKKYNNWSLNLYLDKPSLKAFRESGLQLELRKDDEGQFVVFRRPLSKLIRDEVVRFDPPSLKVVRDGETQDFDGLIGNGSVVTAKVQVYDSRKGKAHRLEGIRIDDLVPFGEKEQFLPEGVLPF
jgi:hypothetical protein